ncbi:pinin [Clinocottus analis]|uniref:pinin n=1 Tax=Clinocottus analis TaxID=304258 RepID=UPI0035BF2631
MLLRLYSGLSGQTARDELPNTRGRESEPSRRSSNRPPAGSSCFHTQRSVGESGERTAAGGARVLEDERAGNMNGAVYISFFQGQLESVLEQVVQLAVQEISKTVGCSLNTLLLEAAGKEQENRRLRLRLQAWESRGRGGDGPQEKAGEGRPDGGRTKPEPPPPPPPLHGPGGRGSEPGALPDIRRLEQRGRLVDQLKAVMEQVLDFAVHELTKIVEASFDDLLLEITKMEREQQDLGETLDRSSAPRVGPGGGRRRGSENDSVSPSGSEDAREEPEGPAHKKAPESNDMDMDRPPVLSVSQDWVPILDQVFGQKWCSDVWQIKELDGGGRGGARRGGGRGLGEGAGPLPPSSETLEPSPSSPQQDPRWTPLEDMEVFSPDEEAADGQRKTTGPGPSPGPSPVPGPPLSPTGSSMLHRLLTLPSQLLDEDKEPASLRPDGERAAPSREEEEEEEDGEDEEEGEDKARKVHRQTHASSSPPAGSASSPPAGSASSPPAGSTSSSVAGSASSFLAGSASLSVAASSSSPAGSASSALRCTACGKRFSSATRLHSHVRTQHPGDRT